MEVKIQLDVNLKIAALRDEGWISCFHRVLIKRNGCDPCHQAALKAVSIWRILESSLSFASRTQLLQNACVRSCP